MIIIIKKRKKQKTEVKAKKKKKVKGWIHVPGLIPLAISSVFNLEIVFACLMSVNKNKEEEGGRKKR